MVTDRTASTSEVDAAELWKWLAVEVTKDQLPALASLRTRYERQAQRIEELEAHRCAPAYGDPLPPGVDIVFEEDS
jgi:hypothetical protein